MNYISTLLQSKKTVFTYKDIEILLWIKSRDTVKSLISRLEKTEILKKIYQWIYVLPNYNIYELASKIKKNSYISFETVLKSSWIIYQDYWTTLFLASNKSWEKESNSITFLYKKIKDSILYNQIGIENKGQYAIASPERAVCDTLYLSPNYYFDNIEHLNTKKLKEIAQIYNKRVILSINTLIDDIEHGNA